VVPFVKVPRVVVKVTEVPAITGPPVESFKVAVMVEVLFPSAGMVVGLADMVMVAVLPINAM